MGCSLLKITSRQNETVKKIVRLRSCPSAEGFLVEGARFVTEIATENILEVFSTCPDEFSDFLEKLGDTPIYEVTEPVMEKLCLKNCAQLFRRKIPKDRTALFCLTAFAIPEMRVR